MASVSPDRNFIDTPSVLFPDRQTGICPFVTKPFCECYCFAINSFKIPLVLHLCGKNYRECSLYKQHASDKQEA